MQPKSKWSDSAKTQTSLRVYTFRDYVLVSLSCFVCLFVFMLYQVYVPVNNYSVLSGRILGSTSIRQGRACVYAKYAAAYFNF